MTIQRATDCGGPLAREELPHGNRLIGGLRHAAALSNALQDGVAPPIRQALSLRSDVFDAPEKAHPHA